MLHDHINSLGQANEARLRSMLPVIGCGSSLPQILREPSDTSSHSVSAVELPVGSLRRCSCEHARRQTSDAVLASQGLRPKRQEKAVNPLSRFEIMVLDHWPQLQISWSKPTASISMMGRTMPLESCGPWHITQAS